jgi:hypothetical protein
LFLGPYDNAESSSAIQAILGIGAGNIGYYENKIILAGAMPSLPTINPIIVIMPRFDNS